METMRDFRSRSSGVSLAWPKRLAMVLAVVALLAGCATRDIDECNKGDRRRCPGTGSPSPEYRLDRTVPS
jgi:hypothetical protein